MPGGGCVGRSNVALARRGWLAAQPRRLRHLHLRRRRRADRGDGVRRDGLLLDLPGGSQPVAASRTDDGLRLTYENRQIPVTILAESDGLTVVIEKAAYRLRIEDRLAAAESVVAGGGRLTAPMPGKIVQVAVKPGDVVERGAALMVLEAMKMEHTIAAPAAGIVGELLYAAGDLVEEGADACCSRSRPEPDGAASDQALRRLRQHRHLGNGSASGWPRCGAKASRRGCITSPE